MNSITEWQRLSSLFPGLAAATVESISAAELPEAYAALLNHTSHMTAMMERFHQEPVDVEVLAHRIDENRYSRAIVLKARTSGTPVQFAFAQYDLGAVSERVRDDILAEKIPIGKILVHHDVECVIKVNGFLRVVPGPILAEHLHTRAGATTFGRVATIDCDRKAAFLVIEISAPIVGRGRPSV